MNFPARILGHSIFQGIDHSASLETSGIGLTSELVAAAITPLSRHCSPVMFLHNALVAPCVSVYICVR